VQALAVAAAMAFSAAGTFALLKLIGAITPLRAASRNEGLGLDVSEHGEEAYTHGEGAILVLPREAEPKAPPVPVPQLEPEGGAA
jgi:ammonium transporter, Amt family